MIKVISRKLNSNLNVNLNLLLKVGYIILLVKIVIAALRLSSYTRGSPPEDNKPVA